MYNDVEYLNAYLNTQERTITGKPIYRIVWSETILENRHGIFRDYVEGTNILIREVDDIRLVKKYSYIRERWVLEKWADGKVAFNKELPDSINGDYIPVYVFEDGKGKYLPPNRKVVDFILAYFRGNVTKDGIPSEAYLEEQETRRIEDELDNHPHFKTSGETRDSIAYTKGLKDVS